MLDTNVFVAYLRANLHEPWVAGRTGHVRFLSSIVLMELRLGADTAKRNRTIDRLRDGFPSTRLVAPAATLYEEAGVLFRTLFADLLGSRADRLGAMNDLLIALSARSIGAELVTGNKKDFERIARHVPGFVWRLP